MREIKFRGREKETLAWKYGSLIYDPDLDLSYIHCFEYYGSDSGLQRDENIIYYVDSNTVGQYTGMKDKNGTEIYEGDILGSDYGSNGVINFGRYTQPFNDDDNTCHIGFYVDWGCYDLFRQDIGYWSKSCTVIGNIHDNPEIMEEQV